MASMLFGTGVALIVVGGLIVGPAGWGLAAVGLVVAVATALGTRGRAVGRGLLIGLVEAVAAIGFLLWWTSGRHSGWTAVTAVAAGVAVLLLAYVAVTVRRIDRRSSA